MSWKSLLVVLALWAAWDLAVPLFGIGQVFAWELRTMLKDDNAPVLIDVRTPGEYRWFHIPGSTNHPAPALPGTEALGPDKDAPILLICMTGHRSPIMAYRLKQRGYTNVHNLTWGISAYALLGGETTSE